MEDSGNTGASSSKSKMSLGSKLSRFKLKLGLHQDNKDSFKSGNKGNGGSTSGIDHKPQSSDSANRSTKVLSASEPTTAIEESPQFSNDLSNKGLLSPIHELWNEAYDELRGEEDKLIKAYEAVLCGDLTTIIGSTVTLSGSKVERKDQMAALLNKKVEEVKNNTWRLKFGGQDIPLKDLARPVIGIIEWADNYISSALSTNPYASIAWGGVSLLLPLTLNPSKQAASLAKGLGVIADIIVRSTMRENLYQRRYESQDNNDNCKAFLQSHLLYRDNLKKLYIEVLKFQARSVSYLSKNTASRLGLDMVKWDDWDSSLGDVTQREDAFNQVYDILKHTRDEEDCEALFTRHKEKISAMVSITCNVEALQRAIEDIQDETKRKSLLNWLCEVDPSENYNNALDKHQATTGDWFLTSQSFKDWKFSPNSFLWLNGKAGSGKSILSSSVIKHLKDLHNSNPEIALAFFYFDFNNRKKQTTIDMLRSIIKQLCCVRPDTPNPIDLLRTQYQEKDNQPDKATLQSALVASLRGFEDVYLVLDALDECPSENGDRNHLLETLLRISREGCKSLHILCTSRREADIENELKSILHPPLNIDINLSTHMEAVNHDIALHIDEAFNAEPFRSWPDVIKFEAKTALIDKADGMFQYIACQFDSLRHHRAPAKIREALKDLPKGLDSTYDRMLQKIHPDYRKQVASLLKWLAFSCRPLTLEEAAEIFILDPEKPMFFDENNRLFTAGEVLNYLPGLVTASKYSTGDGATTEIKFAHFSIKEYLCSTQITQTYFSTPERTAHLKITESCLAYHLQLSESLLINKDNRQRYPLWGYAAKHWAFHFEKISPNSLAASITNKASIACAAYSRSLRNLIQIKFRHEGMKPDQPASPLYYAVCLGAFHLTLQLISNGADVNQLLPGYFAGTALQTAIEQKSEPIIKLLLESGADPNKKAGRLGNALQTAVIYGSLNTLQLLLENGAYVNAEGGEFGNAFQAAAYAKSDLVQVLLDNGANINAKGGLYGNALQAAIVGDKLDVAEMLLARGADVDPPGHNWDEMLARVSNKKIVGQADKLRVFQQNPREYIESRKLEELGPYYEWMDSSDVEELESSDLDSARSEYRRSIEELPRWAGGNEFSIVEPET